MSTIKNVELSDQAVHDTTILAARDYAGTINQAFDIDLEQQMQARRTEQATRQRMEKHSTDAKTLKHRLRTMHHGMTNPCSPDDEHVSAVFSAWTAHRAFARWIDTLMDHSTGDVLHRIFVGDDYLAMLCQDWSDGADPVETARKRGTKERT